MKIGIDISQTAFKGTGVGTFLQCLVDRIISVDSKNQYILFYSSFRKEFAISNFPSFAKASMSKQFQKNVQNVKIKKFKFPPLLLDLIWNKLHIIPIEWLIGDVDIFISSDWTEPPTISAKKITILYDLIVYKYPKETARKIVEVQKRKLAWTKKECEKIICISEATKKDAMDILEIPEDKLKVVYPGISNIVHE